jgi:N-acetyl-anhydromuramyl-L-alanine amidase AmpD
VLVFALSWLGACGSAPATPSGWQREAAGGPPLGLPRTTSARHGTEIEICGRLFDIGTPVVLWHDEGGYSAYRTTARFADDGKPGLRYRPGRAVEVSGAAPAQREAATSTRIDAATFREAATPTLELVQAQVDQFVLHFDVCGTSRECYRVLQDVRNLSVHFLLDADGTIYQTLDLADTAWHARQANSRSVGVEIAQIGCYPVGKTEVLDAWYPRDETGPYLKLPGRLAQFPLRTPGFVGRPERADRIRGAIHASEYEQHDYTAQQNTALARLVAGVARALPRVRLDYPRAADGSVLKRALSDAEFRAFSGVLGHWHVTEQKVDPGPALDWERLLRDARVSMSAAPAAVL